MLEYVAAVIIGLVLLMWSADKFVDGSAAVATRLGMSRLLVGMIIVGFGTSAPEIVVSTLASLEGMPGIALGNAYGSNIANIALILGLTVLIAPIHIDQRVTNREIPVLLLITFAAMGLLYDSVLTRFDASVMLFLFAGFMYWSIRKSIIEKKRLDELREVLERTGECIDCPEGIEMLDTQENNDDVMPMKNSIFWLILGLAFLIGSSRMLVWGAVGIASSFGVSEIIIGLTIVAIGTSLPELASAIAATRKKEHDIVIGNIIGSNFFNALVVVGIAGVICPLDFDPIIVYRDIALSVFLTVLLYVFCLRVSKEKIGVLSRIEGLILLLIYVLYTSYLISLVLGKTFIQPFD